MGLIDFVVNQIQHNQFVTAAVIAAPAAAITFSIRRLPFVIINRIKNFSSLNVRFNSDQLLYKEAVTFLTEKVIKERFTKNYVFSSKEKRITVRGNDNSSAVKMSISSRRVEIGYGVHIGLYRKRLVVIYRKGVTDSNTSSFKEYCTCTFFTRDRNIIYDFMDGIEKYSNEKDMEEPNVKVKVNRSLDKWLDYPPLPLRSMDTVFIAGGKESLIIRHIQEFEKAKDSNHRKGIPHHTGILLYGPPGNGKSSVIHAIASETSRRIFYLNLNTAKDLNELLSGEVNWDTALLVIEDIDAAGINVNRDIPEETDKKNSSMVGLRKVTLSELLNSLDGLMSPDGLIVIATTNYPDALDPALRRPGRFDLSIEVGNLGKDEFNKMASLFEFDPSEYDLPYFSPMSGALLRKFLLEGGIPAVIQYQKSHHSLVSFPVENLEGSENG